MPSLTQTQIDALRNKGLSDEKIQALALKKGFDTKPGFFKRVGSALIQSERRFGESIAGAIGGTFTGTAGKKQIDEANKLNEQVRVNMLSKIKEKQARGEDVTRLLDALKTLDKEVNFYDILDTSTGGSLNKSAKQIFGEAAGVATDILSAGTYSKAGLTGASRFTTGLTRGTPSVVKGITKANTFTRGLVQGAKQGIKAGSSIGLVQGASRAAQENKTAGGIVGSGLRGSIEGGIGGAVVGGLVGGISGAITGRGQRIVRNKEDFVLDLVSEKPTKLIREQAVKEGRVTEPGLFSQSKIIPSTKDYRLADAIDDVVSPKSTVLQNADSISHRVTEINDGVTRLIKDKKVPFNSNQLKTRLLANKEESRLIFASDANAERTYDAVVDEFMKHVNKKDTLGLFQARQQFDKLPAIKKLLESEGLGENVKRSIVLDVRRAANEYIASQLPANNPYRAALRQETLMLEALGNIAEKHAGSIGQSKLSLLVKQYPILKWVVGGVATGAVGGAGVGVGSAILGSVD